MALVAALPTRYDGTRTTYVRAYTVPRRKPHLTFRIMGSTQQLRSYPPRIPAPRSRIRPPQGVVQYGSLQFGVPRTSVLGGIDHRSDGHHTRRPLYFATVRYRRCCRSHADHRTAACCVHPRPPNVQPTWSHELQPPQSSVITTGSVISLGCVPRPAMASPLWTRNRSQRTQRDACSSPATKRSLLWRDSSRLTRHGELAR